VVEPGEYFDHAYNQALAMRDELSPAAFAVFAAWSLLIGTRGHPGLVQAVRLTLSEKSAIWQTFLLRQRAIATLIAGTPAIGPSPPAMLRTPEVR
jgi:hypothetical protein